MLPFTLNVFCCPCGQEARYVRVGINSAREIIIAWTCTSCKQDLLCTITLEDFVKDAPPPTEISISEFDRNFLAKAHIQELKSEG